MTKEGEPSVPSLTSEGRGLSQGSEPMMGPELELTSSALSSPLLPLSETIELLQNLAETERGVTFWEIIGT